MKKMYIATLLAAALSSAAFAAEGEGETVKADSHYFTVQAFYPVSTNKSRDDFTYANFTLAYGRIGEVKGADLSYGLSIVGRDVTGFQGSCLLSYTGGNVKGAAGAGLGSVIGTGLYGAQGSGLFNWVEGDMYGAQGAGVVNVVKGTTKGFQAAAVNISGDTRGMQLGVVNVAGEVKGVQLGIVNISKTMHGVPIGIVNISGNGDIEAVAYASSLTAANAGVRIRAGYVYTMLSVGGYNLDREDDREKSAAGAFYFGVRVPVSPIWTLTRAICTWITARSRRWEKATVSTEWPCRAARRWVSGLPTRSRFSPAAGRATCSTRTAPSRTANSSRCTWVAWPGSFRKPAVTSKGQEKSVLCRSGR